MVTSSSNVGYALLPAGLSNRYNRAMQEFWQIACTTPDRAKADEIAQALVSQQLAACVQISGPIESTYRWEGKIEKSQEWLCCIKTTAKRYEAVEKVIQDLHPYDTPEVIATPLVGGSAKYLEWLRKQVSGVEDRPE